MNPSELTLKDLKASISSGKISAVEVVKAYLARIDKYDHGINAFHEVLADRAIERARQVDTGQITGKLAGLPIAIKDVLCTEWGHTTCSSRMLANYQSPFTATAVCKLESEGAVILGKTNMDEFAMGSSTENCAFGPTRNPWDVDRVPGGSSGGSAAAVAADFCPGAIGSDTGGSIRQPAAFCGVVGMKPTYGRVSRWGLVAYASSLDQIGPIAHTVADVALLLQVISGHDPLDSTSANLPVPPDMDQVDNPAVSGAKLKIGLPRQYISESNDSRINQAVDEALDIYRSHGAEIVDIDLPHTEYGIAAYYIVATAECSSNLARYDGVHYGHRTESANDIIDLYSRSRSEAFGDEVKRRIMLGTYALSSGYYDAYYLKALRVRRLIKQDFDRAFEQCNALICPTTTGPAFKLGEKMDDPLSMYLNDIYTVPCNLAGIPGISMPAGTTELNGCKLPIAIQLLGPAFQEEKLLRIARLYERESGYCNVKPQL